MSKFSDWFSFSKSERVGILVLASLIVFLIGIKIYIKGQKDEINKPVDFSSYEQQIDQFHKNLKELPPKKKPHYYQNDTTKYNYKKSNYQKRNYSNDRRQYKSNAYHKPNKEYPKLNIELNSADTTTLKKLYGIGKVLSMNIIKYRVMLGGYYNKAQLNEVYGIKPATYESIKDQVWVDTSQIKHININKAEFKTILKHPYLDYKQVKAIFYYKNRHTLKSLKQLKDDKIISDSLYVKIAPYFVVE